MLSFGRNPSRPWVLEETAAAPLLRRAVETGINFFDTADSYNDGESEVTTGRLLRRFANRDEVVVATKVFLPTGVGVNNGGLSRRHILSSIDASLRRLNMDYVDLYQIHRFDSLVPVEETIDALNDVVKSGKARYLGASSMSAWQFQKLQFAARRLDGHQFISMQNHYNLIYREEEREMLPLCRDQGIGVVPWSPLARGLLAGNVSENGVPLTNRARTDTFPDGRYEHSSDAQVIEQLAGLARRRGVPPAQVALAWLLHQSAVTAPIIGATQMHHIDDALAATSFKLSSEECAALEAPYRPHDVHGH
jgi:aryl-alcohol dehydrogenase-like predicted oxidoreductase